MADCLVSQRVRSSERVSRVKVYPVFATYSDTHAIKVYPMFATNIGYTLTRLIAIVTVVATTVALTLH